MSRPTTIYARVAQGAAGIVWAGSFAGSAAELNHFGGRAHMALPASLPISLDLVAVAGAAALAARPGDRLARWTLRLFTLASLLLQVATTPWTDEGLVTNVCYAIARAAPVVGGYLTFELTLRAVPEPESPEEGAEWPQGARRAPALALAPEPAPEPILEPLVQELLPLAQRVAAELRRRGHEVRRHNLLRGMAALGRPVGSPAHADALLALLGAA